MTGIDVDYVMKKVTLNKNNINTVFKTMNNRRLVKETTVNNLASNILKGKHFDSTFVVNNTEDVRRLIDGNHRYESIKKAIEKDPSLSITIWMAEYKDKSPEEEKKIFQTWNIGRKQSSDDFVKVWFDTIPFGGEMVRKIPASIYNRNDKIKLRTVTGAHINAVHQRVFEGGYRNGAVAFIHDLTQLGRSDIVTMSAFMTDMTELFGPFDKSEKYWSSGAVQALYRMWYDNRHINRPTYLKALGKILCNKKTERQWREWASLGGMEGSKFFYKNLYRELKELESESAFSDISFKGKPFRTMIEEE